MKIEEIETDDHTIEELSIIRVDWQTKIDRIMAQLKEAKESYLDEGEKADPDWLYSARRAVSMTMNNAKKLDIVIKYRKIEAEKERQENARQRKAQEQKRFEGVFVDMAKAHLEPDIFSYLIECTQQKIEQTSQAIEDQLGLI